MRVCVQLFLDDGIPRCSSQTRKSDRSGENAIFQLVAIHAVRGRGILVYRERCGDIRSIKVTSVSCLIRSRSVKGRYGISSFDCLKQRALVMPALHIFLDYFKSAPIYPDTRPTSQADVSSIVRATAHYLIRFLREILAR